MSPCWWCQSCLLQSCGCCEHKHCWLSELCVWGGCPSGRGLKSWGARTEVQSLCSSRKNWIGGFLLIEQHCVGIGVYGESMFQPFLHVSMWVFFSFLWCLGITKVVSVSLSFYLSEEIPPCVAIYLENPWEGRSSGSFSVSSWLAPKCQGPAGDIWYHTNFVFQE